MLNVMRENLRHLKWVLVLVAASMLLYLGYYFQDPGTGSPDGWVARVNGEAISAQDFYNEARREDDRYRQLLGAQYDQIRQQLQLGRQVVQRLVDERIMLEEAHKLGLEASREEVSRLILEDPSFRDASGGFIGKQRYVETVQRRWPGGVEGFERTLAKEIAIQKWVQLVTEPVAVSDAELERLERARSEKAAIDYVLFPLSEPTYPTEVSEAEVAAWYGSHAELYRRGEGRRLRYLLVDRQAQAAKVAVPDEEIEAFYRANAQTFTRPEQRRARHILFRVAAGTPEADRLSVRNLAESVRKRVEAGEDFASLARSMSQDPASAEQSGDLGYFGRGQMVPAFEKAAFETSVGKVAPVVESEFGFHVVQVTDSRAAGTTPLAELKDQIRRQIQLQRAQQAVLAEAQRVRGMIAQASDLDAVAAKEKLPVEEKVVSREEALPELGPSPEFVETVFRMAPGEVSPPLGVARGMVIAAVVENVPSAVLPLPEVRLRVKSDILADRARQAAIASARRALAKEGNLAEIAKSVNKTVQSAKDLRAGQPIPSLGRAPELEKVLFGPGVVAGSRGVAAVPSGAVLYVVTARESFEPARFQQGKEALMAEVMNRRRMELLQSVLQSLRSTAYRVEINEPLISQVIG